MNNVKIGENAQVKTLTVDLLYTECGCVPHSTTLCSVFFSYVKLLPLYELSMGCSGVIYNSTLSYFREITAYITSYAQQNLKGTDFCKPFCL